VADLLQGAGIAPSQQPIVDSSGDDARIKLRDIIMRQISASRAENERGIFHDTKGNQILDPARLAIEKQIYDLKRRGAAIDNGDIIGETPESEPAPSPAPTPQANVIDLKPARAAPEPRRRAAEPSFPAPIAEPSTTQNFLEWDAGRGGRFP
jgi:hypothetical protein